MQLWVSKLNKNKWKITLIILSVALITSCIFGFTAAWFNHVDSAKANVGMDVKYVDIFATGPIGENQLIPAMYYTIEENKIPKVTVGETSGTYCVFIKIKETGGNESVDYINYNVTNFGWNELSTEAINNYGFKTGDRVKYYYQNITASGQTLKVFSPLNNSAQFQANPELTLEEVYAAKETAGTPITLSVVAAGCKTALQAGSTELPTADEVAFAEVYTAFF